MIPQTPKTDPDHSAYDRFEKLRCGRGRGLVQQLTKFPFTAASNIKSRCSNGNITFPQVIVVTPEAILLLG